MTSNKSNEDEQFFENRVQDIINEDARIRQGVSKCIKSIRSNLCFTNDENYNELYKYKSLIEIKGLQQRFWESYTNIKFHLKERALKNGGTNEEIEKAFYEWLKICINSQKDPNYDYYFELHKLNKEMQVKEILFKNNGKGDLREIFKNKNEQIHDKWRIRLRIISSWFLKRYDWHTAKKIIGVSNKSKFDYVPLIFPRLLGTIIIGFLPFVFSKGAWDLSISLGLKYVLFYILFVIIFILYLIYECYNITRDVKIAKKRGIWVGLGGFTVSLISSVIIVYSMSSHFVQDMTGEWCIHGHVIFLENISFFASIPLLVGIFIRIFWEEKTITEPL